MDESKFIWYDGKLVDWKDSMMHVISHSLHYGGGVFEGLRFYDSENGPAIFRLGDHTKRLFLSAKALHMKVDFSEKDISEATIQIVRENGLKDGYIRPLIVYGYGKMGLNPEGAQVNTIIAPWSWGSYLGHGAVRVKISNIIKTHPGSTDPNAKITGNYVNSILASFDIKKAGYDEALLLDFKGNIAEGPGENVFFVKDGKLITPQLGNILPGITRDSIIQIAKDEGVEVIEKIVTPSEAKECDEAFFTGTAAEITPIKQLDDAMFGDGKIGPLTKKIKEIYMDIVYGKNEKYLSWITFVK